MNTLPNEWSKLHHVYMVSGINLHEIWVELERKLRFKKRANPDVYEREYETFGIDEARELSQWAILKPVAASRKVAAVVAHSFTTEAQNALLKLLEEPPHNTYFFVIVPNLGSILPTLLSRVQTFSAIESIINNKKYENFLTGNIVERMNIVSSIIKSKDKDAAKNLIVYLEKSATLKNYSKILDAKRFISARGASIKIILEHLAISL